MVQPLCLYTVLGFEGVSSLQKLVDVCGETSVVVLGSQGVHTGSLTELSASCIPNSTWLQPWLELRWAFLHLDPPKSIYCCLPESIDPGELPPTLELGLWWYLWCLG